MKRFYNSILMLLVPIIGFSSNLNAVNFIPANNPNIQYYGRWDFSDPLHAKHSWPGTFIVAKFTGSSIGVRTDDNVCYYNVYIDGKFINVFHGDKQGESDYTLATSLSNTPHILKFSKRNFSFNSTIYSFSGLLLDSKGKLLSPSAKPNRKIEFLGDSYTASEGNEVTHPGLKWEEKFPLTNMDKGFSVLVANHYNADYHTICRSGSGLVCDWQANYDLTIPKRWDRTLMEAEEPKWDFKQWQPDLVVILLGLNDSSGLKGKDGQIPDENSLKFRNGYKDFLATLRKDYPKAKIMANGGYPEWMRTNVKQVVDEEKAAGFKDIYYSQYDKVDALYIDGHPTVEGDQTIADQLIQAIDSCKIFTEK